MDDLASTQPVEYLQHLLKYLASPVDPLASLKVVRGADDSIVALRSAEGEYPVVNNVPRMLPHMGDGTTGDLALWQEHQAGMWQEHLDGDQGVFTSDDHGLAQEVGCLIQEIGCGLYLDVGCGARQRPPYMIHAGEGVEWIGIDPFFGGSNRQFPFAQALAEYPPFHPESFDGALWRRPSITSWIRSRHYSEPGECSSPRGSCSSGPCGRGSMPGTWSGC